MVGDGASSGIPVAIGTGETHSAVVRVTHWVVALAVPALIVSGAAILLAHPRLYWGETGALGMPSLVDLPLPLVLAGQSGWGRSLHFLSAWAAVMAGAVYLAWSVGSGHLRRDVWPTRDGLTRTAMADVVAGHLRRAPHRNVDATGFMHYNGPQRVAYSAVVLLLLPAIVWTGLAMSPAVTSVWPWLVDASGGFQSARTLHFLAAVVTVAFALGHVLLVLLSGARVRLRGMITGRRGPRPSREAQPL
jgi:thiosulfate reductase cytochrome b subunit